MNTRTAEHLMTQEERTKYRALANSRRTGAERIFDQLRASQIALDVQARGRTRV